VGVNRLWHCCACYCVFSCASSTRYEHQQPDVLSDHHTNNREEMMRAIIRPDQCLVIGVLEEDSSTKTYVVFMCRFCPAKTPEGQSSVGFEFLYDPKEQAPRKPYEAEFERLTIDPKRLKHVKPYKTD
jgi:hypothetical protein